MLNIKNIKGLKYPDEYFIKFFFKNRLHEKENLTYLEFGCGNGSNLMLPYAYDNSVIGVDYDGTLISMAKDNFSSYEQQDNYFEFYAEDMREFPIKHSNIKADVFLLPSVIYYIGKDDFIKFLMDIIDNNHLNTNIPFYIRVRTPKDFRFGLGQKIAYNSYELPFDVITGEGGANITFYYENEILDILKKYLKLKDYKIFHLDNQNEHNGEVVLNSDIVIWGTIN